MRTFVWVTSWQQQCCGDDFWVGTQVSWSVIPRGEDEWAELLLGREWAEKIEYREEHHDEIDATTTISGKVRSIWEIRCLRRVEIRESREVRVPVRGSAILTQVDRADKWSPEDDLPARTTFDGWVVELETAR